MYKEFYYKIRVYQVRKLKDNGFYEARKYLQRYIEARLNEANISFYKEHFFENEKNYSTVKQLEAIIFIPVEYMPCEIYSALNTNNFCSCISILDTVDDTEIAKAEIKEAREEAV